MAFTKSIMIAAILGSAAAFPFPSFLGTRAVADPVKVQHLPDTGNGVNLKNLSEDDLKDLILVTVGRGVQNYTCPEGATVPQQAKGPTGAVAQLLDVSGNMASFENAIDLLAQVAVTFDRPALAQHAQEGNSKAVINGRDATCFHFFDTQNVPVFDCGEHGIIRAVLNNKVNAPKDAATTPGSNAAAVAWLNLDARAEGSHGITKVIRVETAGGSPPASCDGHSPDETIIVDYSAQYWFFNNGTLSS